MNALRSLLAAGAMLGFVGVANAADVLSADQMDGVVAGVLDTFGPIVVVPNNNNNQQPNNNNVSQTNFAALVTFAK